MIFVFLEIYQIIKETLMYKGLNCFWSSLRERLRTFFQENVDIETNFYDQLS
jgi:hypothetical protein